MLTARNIEILSAIVEEFIETAEPVGSKTLVDKYGLPYSSATIRNDMAQLEELGYLEKPHTSAGRIPSNKGYRFYCENLISVHEDDEEVKYAISNIFTDRSQGLEEAIKESCHVIADMTNLVSGVLGPDASSQTLKHIKLFPIDPKTAICVFVTSSGHTENKMFNFKDDVSIDDIDACTDILNDNLRDTPVTMLNEKLEEVRPLLEKNVKRHEMLFNAFYTAFIKFASESLYVSGAANMMYQPEFSDIEKLKEFTKIMNDSTLFRNLLSEKSVADDTVAMRSDDGTDLVWFDDIAVISSDIKVNDKDTAKLMVVGPNRMQYEKVMSLLDFIRKKAQENYRGDEDGKRKEEES